MKTKFVIPLIIGLICTVISFGQELNQSQLSGLEINIKRLKSEIKIKSDSLLLMELKVKSLKAEVILSKFKDSSNQFRCNFPAKVKVKGGLKRSKSPFGEIITVLVKRESIVLLDYADKYWLIKYKDQIGFLNEIFVLESQEIKVLKESIINKNRLHAKIEAQEKEDKEKNEKIRMYEEAQLLSARNDSIRKEKAKRLEADLLKKIKEDRIRKEQYDAKIKRQNEQIRLQKIEDEKARKEYLITLYGEKVTRRLLNKEIWLGMTDVMAKHSLGTPNDINRTVSIRAVREQWVYSYKYLYFEDGILTSWQE